MKTKVLVNGSWVEGTPVIGEPVQYVSPQGGINQTTYSETPKECLERQWRDSELERTDKSTGLISLCIGGGMGIATIIERV